MSNITRKESMALNSLEEEKQIRILEADKGNYTVELNESTYNEKISSLLESEVCEILRKEPKSQIDRKLWKVLTKHKTVLPVVMKQNDSLPQ
jgi:hypothetical protein